MVNYDNYIVPSRIECSVRVLKELGISNKSVGYGLYEVDPFFLLVYDLFLFRRLR